MLAVEVTLRLSVPLAFVVLAFASAAEGAARGSELQERASRCADRGWAALLYLNNLLAVPPWPCMGHAW